jgi:hypothetical protein
MQNGHAVSSAQDCNCPWFRANKEADTARGASRPGVGSGPIAVVIEPVVEGDHLRRASFDAQATAFALIAIHPEQTSALFFDTHLSHFLPLNHGDSVMKAPKYGRLCRGRKL